VHVFAAGFYPDFIGGVWRSRVFHPDTGAVIVAQPDALDFGSILPGDADTLSFFAVNAGTRDVTVTELINANPFFEPIPDVIPFDVAPGNSVEIPVVFQPGWLGVFSDVIYVINSESQDVQVNVRGEGRDVSADFADALLPETPELSVYPNPGNPDFHISFSLPTRTDIRLAVYDVLGRRVGCPADGFFDAGVHQVMWPAETLPSGIYFVRLEGIPSPQTRKLFLMK
jgi:hypothetical protein